MEGVKRLLLLLPLLALAGCNGDVTYTDAKHIRHYNTSGYGIDSFCDESGNRVYVTDHGSIAVLKGDC